MDGIIAAAITGGLALIGVIITVAATVRKGNRDILNKMKQQSEMDDARLNAKLEKFQIMTTYKQLFFDGQYLTSVEYDIIRPNIEA